MSKESISLSSGSITKTIHVHLPDKGQSTTIGFDDFFETGKCVFLETNNECLIGSIEKILICKGDCYILNLVGSSREILVFSLNDGVFKKKIGTLGKGPGEYQKIVDFDIINDHLYILDGTGKKIINLNLDGVFRKSITLKVHPRSFAAINDDLFILHLQPYGYLPNKKFTIAWIDSQGEIIKYMIPIKKSEPEIARPFAFSRSQKDIYFTYSLSNTIFKVSGLNIDTICSLDFGRNNLNTNTVKYRKAGEEMPSSNWINDLKDCESAYFLNHYFFGTSFLTISYIYMNKVRSLFLNTDTKLLLEGTRYKSEYPMGLTTIRPYGVFQDSILFISNASSFRDRLITEEKKYQEKHPPFLNINKIDQIIEDEHFNLRNPILILAKIK